MKINKKRLPSNTNSWNEAEFKRLVENGSKLIDLPLMKNINPEEHSFAGGVINEVDEAVFSEGCGFINTN